MATRPPSRSNSCAAASPIPLLPPVIRIFLSASLPMVVPPMMFSHLISFGGSNSSQHCPVIADPLVEAARCFYLAVEREQLGALQSLAFFRCEVQRTATTEY